MKVIAPHPRNKKLEQIKWWTILPDGSFEICFNDGTLAHSERGYAVNFETREMKEIKGGVFGFSLKEGGPISRDMEYVAFPMVKETGRENGSDAEALYQGRPRNYCTEKQTKSNKRGD